MPSATTTKKPAAKAAAKASATTENKAAAKAAPAATEKPVVVGTLRAKDLVARVAESTGAKVKDIKATVEATLAELGRALDAGEALNLPPLGRVKITPAKEGAEAAPMKLKLRRGAGGGAGGNAGGGGKGKQAKEALAVDGEDS